MEYINSKVGKNLVVNGARYLLDRRNWRVVFFLARGRKEV